MADNRFAKWLRAHIVAWWAWLAVGSIVFAGMQAVAVGIARQRRRGVPPAP